MRSGREGLRILPEDMPHDRPDHLRALGLKGFQGPGVKTYGDNERGSVFQGGVEVYDFTGSVGSLGDRVGRRTENPTRHHP